MIQHLIKKARLADHLQDKIVTLPKLPDGVFTADATGRAKFATGFVNSELVLDASLDKGDLAPASVQSGSNAVTFPFAAAGEENVSVTITFPTAFAAPPAIIASVEGANVGIVSIAVTASGFTITVRDDKGTDYTTGQAATVRWIAIEV